MEKSVEEIITQGSDNHNKKPKWNLIVGKQGENVPIKAEAPTQQPNRRERSESVPNVSLKGDEVNAWKLSSKLKGVPEKQEEPVRPSPILASEPDQAKSEEISNSLYKAIWRSLEGGPGQPLSPVRSLGDWKVVGSLSPTHRHIDPIDQLLEEREGNSGYSSVDTHSRRLRSASMIGDLLSGQPSAGEITSPCLASPCQATISANSFGTYQGEGDQVAQLPVMLHADLGVSNAEEATRIFERSSMDSVLDDDEDDLAGVPGSKNGSSDFFRNMKFGPIGSTLSVPTSPSLGGGVGAPTILSGNLERRRSSILGFGDWPLSAGVTRQQHEIPDLAVCNVDDYFGEESLRLESITAVPKAENRFPRRQSQVADDLTDLDEQFMALAFSSSPKGTASAGGYHGMASPYFGHSSAASIHAFADFDDLQHGVGGGYYHPHQQQGQGQSRHHHQNGGYGESTFQLNSYTGPLWAVEFKSGRTEIFYVLEEEGAPEIPCKVGDLVIVEADRGEDLGKVTAEISVAKMRSFISSSSSLDDSPDEDDPQDKNQISPELATLLKSKEIIPKRIHRLATHSDLKMLQAKSQEEALAMVRCQSRIRQKKLPMDVVDAEYQWDRNKLTFFFVADRRIDFRELVRDLFRIYKTRIWMCAVDKHSPRMINYLGGLVPVHRTKQQDDAASSTVAGSAGAV